RYFHTCPTRRSSDLNPVYGDENIQTSNDNIVDEAHEEEEAVYEMRKDKPEKKKKKKKSKFKTIVLPILMALAVIVLVIFGTKALDRKSTRLNSSHVS